MYIGGRFTWLRQSRGFDSYLVLVLICFIQIWCSIVAIKEHVCVSTTSVFADLRDSIAAGVYTYIYIHTKSRCVCVCVCVCARAHTRVFVSTYVHVFGCTSSAWVQLLGSLVTGVYMVHGTWL